MFVVSPIRPSSYSFPRGIFFFVSLRNMQIYSFNLYSTHKKKAAHQPHGMHSIVLQLPYPMYREMNGECQVESLGIQPERCQSWLALNEVKHTEITTTSTQRTNILRNTVQVEMSENTVNQLTQYPVDDQDAFWQNTFHNPIPPASIAFAVCFSFSLLL